MMERIVGFLGLWVFIFLAWLLSNNKRKMNFKTILSGVALQFLIGVILLWTPFGKSFFIGTNEFISKILSFSDAGAEFVFGKTFQDHFFAFSVMPTIIFVSTLMSLFFYLGIIQKIVEFFSWIMFKLMDVSGSEALASSANIFMGQTEAALVIRPYLETMTKSEIMALMTGGMANVAGGVMAAYVSFGADPGHLLTGSILSAPASLVIAKIIFPETEVSSTKGHVTLNIPINDANFLDAACRGASEGLTLAINVAAMLIAFIGLTTLLNYFLTFLPLVSGEPLTFEKILGWFFSPLAYLMGVTFKDSSLIGTLLGKKMFLNEFVAYVDLRQMKNILSPRSFTIATYALCGFANFASIAIQIGGIGNLVPSQRKNLAELGVKSMLGGTLSTLMTATIAGILLPD